ncbi:RNA-binding domain-containing protein [Saccharata proteae CBS 121410]|uniref:RNA-binding domain-containing protein n=1 Tax=Saccharata proteae CBS 121410 TaxID=1314787 RepID=A0A9P4HN58_9PEZI|nr:RNA-binding domain-containing protein [Saccharata proteae CBS 121410]
MSPHPKRQRLSEDGAAASIAVNEAAAQPAPSDASKQTSKKPDAPRRQLFIRSLPAETTTDDLTEHFSQSYPIKHASAVLDPTTKQCKGYGFVTFADAEDAQRAREEFNGSEIRGRKIKVEIAEPRHRDPEHKGTAQPSNVASAKAKREEAKQLASQSKLIIRNLPWSVKTPEQLSLLFRSYGKVKHCVIPSKGRGLMAGYGFVVLRGRNNAEKAMKALNGKEIDGRQIAVDWAVDKETWQKQQNEDADSPDAQAEDMDMKDGANEDAGSQASDESGDEDEEDDEEDSDGDEDEDDEDEDDEDEIDEEDDTTSRPQTSTQSTLFIRNLPFTCTDEVLEEHFAQFGGVRYGRVVVDPATERPRGTGFVCFFQEEDAIACLKEAPKHQGPVAPKDAKPIVSHSVLQNTDVDPTGRYTMDGRVLQLSLAVNRSEAARLNAEGVAYRSHRDKDKRRLYLLSEGTIASNSPLYNSLSPSEVTMREASAKQRKMLIESNPSLHLSLTRLSVRNIPRSITSKDLKQLAREAVVGFATDVKEGKRQRLSREELERGAEEMKEAEKERKAKGKGVVKQAKIVFEGREGSKVNENSGAGRSRGYGFIEYYTHRSALMGLRWLNGHSIGYQTLEKKGKKRPTPEDVQDRKKRLIVEFAIENAQVVSRRKEREVKMREPKPREEGEAGRREKGGDRKGRDDGKGRGKPGDKKRKRGQEDAGRGSEGKDSTEDASGNPKDKDEKLAKQQRIIARKRQLRRSRKKGGKA